MVFSFITATVIEEVCSALPSAGSTYIWAAEAGGFKYRRPLGFVVAWWSTTAWTTFCASNTQGTVVRAKVLRIINEFIRSTLRVS